MLTGDTENPQSNITFTRLDLDGNPFVHQYTQECAGSPQPFLQITTDGARHSPDA